MTKEEALSKIKDTTTYIKELNACIKALKALV